MHRLDVIAVVGVLVLVMPVNAQPADSATSGAEPTVKAHEFVQSLRPHQWRASKLIGLDVYGHDDEKLGDLTDLLVAADGDQVVVIGVGGFLGLAGREVAVPLRSLEWRFGQRPTRADRRAAPTPSDEGAGTAARKTVDNTRRGYPDFAVLECRKTC